MPTASGDPADIIPAICTAACPRLLEEPHEDPPGSQTYTVTIPHLRSSVRPLRRRRHGLRLPLVAAEQRNLLEALPRQSGVEPPEVPRRPRVELPRHVGQLPRQRVRALDLRLRRPAVVEDHVAVQVGEALAQPLLAGNHAALLRRDDLLA